ncbi:MAG: endolytic transglycosylase MltG [Acidimicrobiaceae bacterium]|nr:endolytic transglycosylase MltG [Acidimicrobiaceae bacterium]MYL02613.1 endolytic transglycosylase MltG [Acidimicrobiaceae bacterium]
MDQGAMVVVEEELGDDPLVDPVYDADDRNWVRYRPFWGGFIRLVVLGVIVVLAVLWVRGRVYGWVDAQVTPEGLPGDAIELTIPQGASVNEIAGELQSAGVISNATVFRYWLRCDGLLTITGFLGCDTVVAVEAGDYILYENMDFASVRTVFDAGPLPEVFELVRIPEGLRWIEMAPRLLEENPVFERDDLEAAYVSLVREASYLPDDARARSLEGMLFPATYDINADDLADEHGFLLRMSDEFDRRLARLLEDPGVHPDIVELGLRPYDVVIVASLVEEEALLQQDRAKIARVIYNRLQEGMRLDIDATACYAAGKACADLTSEDIRRDSPWNTRVVTGLPPTPISAPGEASLTAALQPTDGNWLFYVRTDEGGVRGAHYFSETYEEHLEQVQICRELGYC